MISSLSGAPLTAADYANSVYVVWMTITLNKLDPSPFMACPLLFLCFQIFLCMLLNNTRFCVCVCLSALNFSFVLYLMLVTNLAHRLSSSCVSGRAVLLRSDYVCIHALSVRTFIVSVRILSAFRSRMSWVRRRRKCTWKCLWSSSFLKSMSRYRLWFLLSSWHGTEQQ